MKSRKFAAFRSHASITVALSVALIGHFAAPSVSAAARTWTGGSGDWETGQTGGWSAAWVAGDTGTFNGAGGTVTVKSPIASGTLAFSGGNYTLQSDGATVRVMTVGGTTTLGNGVTTTIGNNVTYTRGAATIYDGNTKATSTLNIDSGGKLATTGTNSTMTFTETTANVNTGGTIECASSMVVGTTADGATLNVLGGTVTIGTANVGSNLVLGNSGTTNPVSNFKITGGSLSLPLAPSAGNGTIRVGATSGSGATGTIDLEGGTVTVSRIYEGMAGHNSTLNLHGGTIKATGDQTNFIAVDNVWVKSGGVTFDTNGKAITVAMDMLTDVSSLNGGLTLDDTAVTKGTLTLTGTNTYTGATTIAAGTLALGGSGSIASSSGVKLSSASAKFDVTAATSGFTLGAAQTLSGIGTVVATDKTVTAAGTLAPGNSPGTLTQDGGTLQLGANGNLNWQIHNASAVPGTGYDTVSLINGSTLDLTQLSEASKYNINLWSLSGLGPDVNGNAINFDNTQEYTWTLFSTGAAITGFNTNLFNIVTGASNGTSGFSNGLGAGSFTVALGDSNTDLMLKFVPEPGAALLGGLGLLALLRRRRD